MRITFKNISIKYHVKSSVKRKGKGQLKRRVVNFETVADPNVIQLKKSKK